MNVFQKTSEQVNLLYEYDKSERKRIFLDQEKKIDLSHIWINHAPANHLKGLSRSTLPKEHKKVERKDDEYRLEFTGDWYLGEKKIEQIKIQISWGEIEENIDIPSCCKIRGLKKCIEKIERIGELKSHKQFLFYFKNLPLQDEFTVDEYGIGNKDVIVIATSSEELSEEVSSHEKAIGSGYSSIEDFENYFAQMKRKINIVCQISIPIPYTTKIEYGSGCSAGGYTIITNHHVIKDAVKNKRKIYAKFFHDGRDHKSNEMGQKPIKVELEENIVCWSGSIDNEPVTADNLDYAILSIKPPTDLNHLKALQEVDEVGEQFFQEALDHCNKPNKNREEEKKRKLRANIIQHPLEENDPPKQIAFRDNRTYDNHRLELHYKSETKVGASGSPVINDEGNWIGLHYASCIRIKKELFRHKEELLKELKFISQPELSDNEALCYKKEEEILYIFINGKHRGSCSHDAEGKNQFSLRDLIKKSEQVTSNQYTLESFIFSFLIRHNVNIKEDHTKCKTAIEVAVIFEDLLKNDQAKLIEKNKAGEKGKIAWEEKQKILEREAWEEKLKSSEKEQKYFLSRVKKYKYVIGVGAITLIGVLVSSLLWWRSSSQKRLKK